MLPSYRNQSINQFLYEGNTGILLCKSIDWLLSIWGQHWLLIVYIRLMFEVKFGDDPLPLFVWYIIRNRVTFLCVGSSRLTLLGMFDGGWSTQAEKRRLVVVSSAGRFQDKFPFANNWHASSKFAERIMVAHAFHYAKQVRSSQSFFKLLQSSVKKAFWEFGIENVKDNFSTVRLV